MLVRAATAREGGAAVGAPSPVVRMVEDKDGGHIRAACNRREDRGAAEETVVDGMAEGTWPRGQWPRQAQDPCEHDSQEVFWRVVAAVHGREGLWAGHVAPTKPPQHVCVSSPPTPVWAMVSQDDHLRSAVGNRADDRIVQCEHVS